MNGQLNRPPSGAPVAAFDLNGTLISGHSIPRFVVSAAGPIRTGWAIVRSVRPTIRSGSRATFKSEILDNVLAGRSAAEVRAVGEAVAEKLVRDELRADIAARVDQHRFAGHQLVMVTAALDVYARPIAERLGFDAVLSAVVELSDGNCTGRILDADLRHEAKVRALKDWLGEVDSVVYAYGNSEDDQELVEFAKATRQRVERDRTTSAR